MRSIKFLPLLLLLFTACAQTQDTETETEEVAKTVVDQPEVTKAVATVMPLGDRDITGSVTFEEAEEGVLVKGSFLGLDAGSHGFHIHEYGDCTAEDGTSAGGHFNPRDNKHGAPTQDNRHMGDMGNLVAVSGEVATIEYIDSHISLDQIIGRGVIIHAGEDDLESQPSGAAGPRIACGVIGIAITE